MSQESPATAVLTNMAIKKICIFACRSHLACVESTFVTRSPDFGIDQYCMDIQWYNIFWFMSLAVLECKRVKIYKLLRARKRERERYKCCINVSKCLYI